MKIKLIVIGKTERQYLPMLEDYQKRLSYYSSFETIIIPYLKSRKNFSEKETLSQEGKLILEKLKPNDFMILLDKNGKEISSIAFAGFLQTKFNQGQINIVFVIGGAYGFDKSIYERANFQLSFSKFTFPHQLFRLIFMEQLYRAFTILKNEKYHHK